MAAPVAGGFEVQVPEWPEPLRVVCLHAPNVEDPDLAKLLTFEAMHASLCGLADHVPVVLCGDLNTPQFEARDGTIQTFAQTPKGTLKARLCERHDNAERMILAGPPGGEMLFARCTATRRRTARGRRVKESARDSGSTTSSSLPVWLRSRARTITMPANMASRIILRCTRPLRSRQIDWLSHRRARPNPDVRPIRRPLRPLLSREA